MLNELIQTNKLTTIFTSQLSKRRLLCFNRNFQEICTAKIIISSSGIKKPFIDSIHYSDYIYFRPTFSLLIHISQQPISSSDIQYYVNHYYQNFYVVLYTPHELIDKFVGFISAICLL